MYRGRPFDAPFEEGGGGIRCCCCLLAVTRHAGKCSSLVFHSLLSASRRVAQSDFLFLKKQELSTLGSIKVLYGLKLKIQKVLSLLLYSLKQHPRAHILLYSM